MIETSENQGILIVTPTQSRLDASIAPKLKAALMQCIADGHQRLVIDLGNVVFMDSSALGVLVSVLKQAGPQGAVALARPNPAVTKVLKLTRLDRIFSIHEDPDDGVAGLNA